MKLFTILILFVGTALLTYAKDRVKKKSPIKHIVVLMMENRAFDHMLGWMTRGGKYGDIRVDGIYGSECNPKDIQKDDEYLCVDDKAHEVTRDPPHSYTSTTEEIFACKEYF